MSATTTEGWLETNQRGLAAALGEVRAALDRDISRADAGPSETAVPEARPAPAPGGAKPAAALDALCAAFGLSPFERRLLLLCAGPELDATFASACAAAHGDPARPIPPSGWRWPRCLGRTGAP